jgi:regulator of nucleoside diphosphate kinase
MTATREVSNPPWIVISEADHERLSRLAASAFDRSPDVAARLLGELDRAEVVSPDRLPPNVVAIGSTVEFMDRGGGPRKVTLVYPGEADIARGRVSVLTPIGAALIGLSPGQSITWLGLDGQERWLTVLAVEPPAEVERAPEPDPAAA